MAKESKQPVTEVKAFARYIHVSPRKLRLLADLIRKTQVDTALQQLRYSSQKGALPLAKVINSAIANAVHNFELKKEDLFIKTLTIDGGPVLKTYTPRAQGRAFMLRKRTSHINLVLEPRVRVAKSKKSIFSMRPKRTQEPHAAKAEEVESDKTADVKVKPRQAPKSDEKIKQHLVNLKRRLFNRRSGP